MRSAKRKLWVTALAATFVAIWSCGPAEVEDGAGDLTDRTTYPSGPYGLNEGQVLRNIDTFVSPDGSPFSFNDIFKDEHNRVLLVTTAAGWCGACIDEQPKLVELYRQLSGRGLAVVGAFFEDDQFSPATVAQVREWKSHYGLPYHMVLDETFELQVYYNRTLTPMTMVVDVDTMKIIKITTGFDAQVIRAVIEANLPL